jgi:hypothetical protein
MASSASQNKCIVFRLLAAVVLLCAACSSPIRYNDPVLLPETAATLATLAALPATSPIHRVLSLDGGALKGISEAAVLEGIEKAKGKPISQLFDYVLGTSTGSILAVGVAVPDESGKPKFTASKLKQLYYDLGGILFPTPVGDIRSATAGRGNNCFKTTTNNRNNKRVPCAFNGAALAYFLQQHMGTTTLGQALVRVGIGITVHLNNKFIPVLISDIPSSPYSSWAKDFPLWQASYISSLFQPVFAPIKHSFLFSIANPPATLPLFSQKRNSIAFIPFDKRYFDAGPLTELEVLDGANAELNTPAHWLLSNDTTELLGNPIGSGGPNWANDTVVIYTLSFQRKFDITVKRYSTYQEGERIYRVSEPYVPLSTTAAIKAPGTIYEVTIGLNAGKQLANASLAYLDSVASAATELTESAAFKAVLDTLK